jgi:hypothetical protein
VKHPVAAGHDFRQQRLVTRISLDELQIIPVATPGQVFQGAGAQIVENPHLGTLAAQGLGQMGTDESGSAGDEGLHGEWRVNLGKSPRESSCWRGFFMRRT